MTLHAPAFPEAAVRARARSGAAAAFPDVSGHGAELHGADPDARPADPLDALRLVPPVFVPRRLEKLIDLAREPVYRDVVLDTLVGGFASALPLYLSAFGPAQVANADLGVAASRQAGRLGIPMVVGEHVVAANGHGGSPLHRIEAYTAEVADGRGGVVVQQSAEDADGDGWRRVYRDARARRLLESGRLAFELKVGQGAVPGLGGTTLLDGVPRFGGPGTFTDEILRQRIRLMRNIFPRARVWVKLPPARDVEVAALVAWDAGADAVTVDGAEGGTGWAPTAFLGHVGLPLGECLRRIGDQDACLLVSGRMWEGTRVAKSLALGATAAGLGRAALVAVDENPTAGLVNLVDCLAVELRMLTSAMGKYHCGELSREDVWATAEMSTMDTLAGLW